LIFLSSFCSLHLLKALIILILKETKILDVLISLCLRKDSQYFDQIFNDQYDASHLPGLLLKNGIAPLAYENQNTTGNLKFFPPFFSQQLKTYHRQSMLRNLQIRAVFNTIGIELAKNNIQFVALKGIYLQHVLYKNPGLRPMVDIDILISPNKLLLAREILIKMGGTEIFNDQSEYINSLRHQSFPIILKGISIEIHRNIVDSFDNLVSIDQQLIFKESIPYTIGDVKCMVLSNELLLVHLCHHVFSTLQGGTVRLISYFDIHFLVEKSGKVLEWNKIKGLCEKSGAFHSVSKTLSIVKHLFETQYIPEYFLTDKTSLNDYIQLLTKAVLYARVNTDNLHYLNKFSKIHGLLNRFRYMTNRLIPDRRYVMYKYQTNKIHLVFAGYWKELFKFLCSGTKTIIKHFFKNQRKYNKIN
jgi:hypothetical protein